MSLVELRGSVEPTDWRLARFVVVQPTASATSHHPARIVEPASGDEEPRPTLDQDALLRFRGRWVSVPEAQVGVVQLLLDRFQTTVSDDDLLAVYRGAGDDGASRKLAGALHRLRMRVPECGLALNRVRGRGYILDHAHAPVS